MFSARLVFVIAAVLAGSAVGLGAFGAHGLAGRIEGLGYGDELSKRLGWFETGVRYQMYHALALLVLATAASRAGTAVPAVAAGGFLVGVLLFCGSLYGLTFVGSNLRWLGAITPLGGLSMLVGWASAAVWGWRNL